jgi:hypothetical protein
MQTGFVTFHPMVLLAAGYAAYFNKNVIHSFEQSNDTPGFIKSREFFDWMSN